MMGLRSLLCYTVLLLLQIVCAQDVVQETDKDVRRPIWNVAHMVNALYQADYYLDMGANSLEFDVAFDWEGTAKYTFHGIPCDCFRSCVRYERFVPFIDYMRQLTTPGHPKFRENLVLLFMDLKIHGLTPAAKLRAGVDVATKLLNYYWEGGISKARAYILISLPSVNHLEFIESFRRTLSESKNFSYYDSKIGYDFSGNEDLDDIRNALKAIKLTDHIWQGDGITNCLPRGTTRLREALRRRDQPGLTYVDKVYWWTVDKMSTMRTTLRMGVDAMITNYPDRLVSVLAEEEFSGKLKLATFEDSPWQKLPRRTENFISQVPQARGGSISREDYINDEEDEILYNC
ncbi:dermonecrotic toxin StSicTox-betaIB1i-like [Stegodyphus dumicola]|uniref:dermonecrotic toxin StSicTox-betaIB1i-like n=1 Tax=Stegodyphus dumicola TaxID=202533 RepID=UPI0015B1F049|nr:dermonecrotic toxin StSicTox-betaIB1i-like [Stegodyphus dumicola]